MNCPTDWRKAIDAAWDKAPTGRTSWADLVGTIRSILEQVPTEELSPLDALVAIDEAIAAFCRVALLLDGANCARLRAEKGLKP